MGHHGALVHHWRSLSELRSYIGISLYTLRADSSVKPEHLMGGSGSAWPAWRAAAARQVESPGCGEWELKWATDSPPRTGTGPVTGKFPGCCLRVPTYLRAQSKGERGRSPMPDKFRHPHGTLELDQSLPPTPHTNRRYLPSQEVSLCYASCRQRAWPLFSRT